MPEDFNKFKRRDTLLAGSFLALFVGGGLYLTKLILEEIPDEILGGAVVVGAVGVAIHGLMHIGNSDSSK